MSEEEQKKCAFMLLDIVEKLKPPESIKNAQQGDITLTTGEWTVSFFYDCGEMDYIDHFITPNGQKLDVWGCKTIKDETWQKIIQDWRGVGDLERLRETYKQP